MQNINWTCMDCSGTTGYFLYTNNTSLQCYTGCASCTGVASDQCTSCTSGFYLQPSPNSNECNTTCPSPYVQTTEATCGKCSSTNLMYYNHTCVSSCPITTYSALNEYDNEYECQPCYIGCDICQDGTQYTCSSCSYGFYYYYYNNTCSTGCPSDMFANPQTRVCDQCQDPCTTCSQPNNYSCTECQSGYYLLNMTCVTSCPFTYYHGFIGEVGLVQDPACLPKLLLSFTLSLITAARIINIEFNYSIDILLLAICQRLQAQIGGTQIDNVLYVITPLTDSMVQFEYLGDQYYPPLSLLNVTIDLDSDFNNDLYEQYLILNKSATIQLKEIYPFTTTEIEILSTSSTFASYGGSITSTTQAVTSTIQDALSLSMVRLQMISEIVQILRFIDIHWPPNVAQMFATSDIDPTSIVLNVDFITGWEDQLNNQNYTMPRNFDDYEIPPFLANNYDYELSNLFLWISFAVIGSLLFNLSKKKLRSVTNKLRVPKTNSKKKFRDYFVIAVHKLSRLLNRTDDSIFWNLLLMFVLSIFQSGVLWSFLNIRYSSTLTEASTAATNASLAIAVIFLAIYVTLALMIFKILANNLPYLLRTEEYLRPLRLRRFRILFEDCDCEKVLRISFVPISLVRSFILAATIALMADYPIPQISIFWSANAAFILYYIFCQPLKEKWILRMTLIIEVLAFGCVTFTLVLGIVERFVTIDPLTLDEVGFGFISLSMGSVFAGLLISLIQILQLMQRIYQKLKKAQEKEKRSASISLLEIHAQNETMSPGIPQKGPLNSPLEKLSKKRKQRNLTPVCETKDIQMFEDIKKLKLEFICKTTEGKQAFEGLRTWWESTRADINQNDLTAKEVLSEE